MSDHNFARLRAYILEHSESQDWPTARLEWALQDIEDLGEAAEACPCGYEPIRHLCWLQNKKNDDLVFVGNVCVERFMPEHGIKRVTDGLKRIQLDDEKAPNEALLIWARTMGVITKWEYDFGMNTCRKRAMSERRMQKRRQINHLIRARLEANRGNLAKRRAPMPTLRQAER